MIEFQNVSVTYGERIHALQNLTLAIPEGQFVCLVGLTGSGKSTILKLLLREIRATQGRVIVRGRDLAAIPWKHVPDVRRNIGLIPQDIGLLPNKKVWENLAYAMRAAGHARREVRQKVPEMLERFGVLHRADAFPAELSGGEQQRVAIARALINNPAILLADEPTAHLDPETSLEIVGVLQAINTRGTTVIMATHDMVSVSDLRKRTVRLDAGRVIEDIPEEQIVA